VNRTNAAPEKEKEAMNASTETKPTRPPVPAPGPALGGKMHAILHRRYGTPDVLAFEETERPIPGPDQVLVRVQAAGASVGDHHIVTGLPYLIRLSPFGGVPRPRNLVPGTAMSGKVEAVGAKVTSFRPVDEVYGEAPSGAFAEYAVVPAKAIARKPVNLSFEEAAVAPWAVTALQGLRDVGRLQAGQKVLINGASGGVGTWAVQIAKALGAHVTAVCSTRNVEMVRALGADEVIDYRQADFAEGGARFDLLLDLVGNRSLSDFRKALKPEGTYISCGGGDSGLRWLFRIGVVLVTSLFTRQKLTTFVVNPNAKDLLTLKEMIEAGKARPIIERRYPLSEVPAAIRHVGARHAQGQTVIRVAG
jgi:NADPH:quinone reductase-like Zn-dependent oxidoreductase